jgi:hypothetical protein
MKKVPEFVWVKTFHGWVPEKRSIERIEALQAYPEKRETVRHQLNSEYAKMSLDQLIAIWPAPEIPPEDKFNLAAEQKAHLLDAAVPSG